MIATLKASGTFNFKTAVVNKSTKYQIINFDANTSNYAEGVKAAYFYKNHDSLNHYYSFNNIYKKMPVIGIY